MSNINNDTVNNWILNFVDFMLFQNQGSGENDNCDMGSNTTLYKNTEKAFREM